MSPVKARHLAAAIVVVLAVAGHANGQQSVRYAVEPKASLAWWQIDPNFAHLWATTCPDDPSWQPGEGRSPGYYVDYYRVHKTPDSAHPEKRIPLYPRTRLRYVCSVAVLGQVDVSDTADWTVAGGQISVLADSLVTGLDMRDAFARRSIFETRRFPAVRFQIDSITDRQMINDTLRAVAVGTFELRGVRTQMKAPLRAWHEGGGLRVKADMQFPAKDLTGLYGMSQQAVGMGVTLGMWKTIHMGIDVLLNRVPSPTGD